MMFSPKKRSYYEGYFSKGKRHGYGRFMVEDRHDLKGQWNNDMFIN